MKNLLKPIILLICLNLFNWLVIFNGLFNSSFKVDFLKVGQGDSELIQTKNRVILIDAGPGKETKQQLEKVLPYYRKTIDLVIISHPNQDHFKGLLDILEKYQVRAVMVNTLSYPNKEYQELIQELEKRNILLIQGLKGVKIDLNPDKLLILAPDKIDSKESDVNSNSLVAFYTNENACFLFPGDIDASVEKKILPLIDASPCLYRVLKVAHHGSKYSTDENFLKIFQPNFAVIEVGKNSYSHPHPELLERLNKIRAEIFRTDLNGTIQFYFDSKFNLLHRFL